MTSNQINYAKLKEDIRHNLEMESQGRFQNTEQQRHNVETENVNWYSARESARHNVASEGISERQVAATIYNAEVSAAATRAAAAMSASASRYVADTNYASSVYGADVNKSIADSNRQINALQNLAKLEQDKQLAHNKNVTSVGTALINAGGRLLGNFASIIS